MLLLFVRDSFVVCALFVCVCVWMFFLHSSSRSVHLLSFFISLQILVAFEKQKMLLSSSRKTWQQLEWSAAHLKIRATHLQYIAQNSCDSMYTKRIMFIYVSIQNNKNLSRIVWTELYMNEMDREQESSNLHCMHPLMQ